MANINFVNPRASRDVTLWDRITGHFVTFRSFKGKPHLTGGHVNGCTYSVGKTRETTTDQGNLAYRNLRTAGYVVWEPKGIYSDFPRILD